MPIRMPLLLACLLCAGCSAIPEITHEPLYHNPFPQLARVAVLPFYNQSGDPTVNQDEVAIAYYTELQQIRGFEVMPVPVAKQLAAASGIEPQTPEDFQKLAQALGVDVLVVGSVTEYTPYYPPRMGLAVDWYAANPGFHPIPPGYGLPWGTTDEEYIPDSLVFEAEFALAREQLATQTPIPEHSLPSEYAPLDEVRGASAEIKSAEEKVEELPEPQLIDPLHAPQGDIAASDTPQLPPDWPDPRGFIPPPPSAERPQYLPQSRPIISHTRLYDGHDSDFTERLASYYYFRDDARFGGWQAYLQRTGDFMRFCCHLHITEILAARGGAGETRVVWRWPIGRYDP